MTRISIPSRRAVFAGGAALLATPAMAAGAGHAQGLAPDAALARLMAGNTRYIAGRAAHPDADVARRISLARGQHPIATVIACADSRVPPELIFDQGLGDLFTIRVAGNVIDDAVLGSVEYSVIHLGVRLVMVLGHERCGAVQATVDALGGHGSPDDRDSHIGALAALIAPAVRAVPPGAPDRVDAAVLINARQAAAHLLSLSRPLQARARAGELRVVSARYDLDDGKVADVRAAA